MEHKIGTRVIAIQSVKDGVVYSMGEGSYLGMQCPTGTGVSCIDLLGANNIPSPAIKLDNGVTVYGVECWWAEASRLRAKFSGMEWKTVPVSSYRPAGFTPPG